VVVLGSNFVFNKISFYVDFFGEPVVDFVIQTAELLTKKEGSPGIVAIGFLIGLIFAIFSLWKKSRDQISAIITLRRLVEEYANVKEFSANFDAFRAKVLKTGKEAKVPSPYFTLSEAWDEYSETIVIDEVNGTVTQRNSIRPGSFLNIEDLGFGPGVLRIIPNIFVSLGLFLTFLGLVAALNEFSLTMASSPSGGNQNLQSAMTNFMQIASAKFIMSLVGLLCSIVFAIFLKWQNGKVDHVLRDLCIKLERRLVFVSLEDIGFRQLEAAVEQREHLRKIGFEMVAELQKPLEALPEHISRSIAEKIDPIFDKVSSMGTSSMEGMVGDLSSQLSHSVGNALNRASESLGEASDRIGSMVDKMNVSNAQMGEGMQTALGQMASAITDLRDQVSATGKTASATMTEGAEQLLGVMNETLKGIRDNTSEGAQAMSAAAEELRKSAVNFRDELSAAATDGAAAVERQMAATSQQANQAISGAGDALLESFTATGQEIARLGSEMGDTVGGELISRLEGIGTQLEDMADAIAQSVTGARSVSAGLKTSADAIAGASSSFEGASRDIVTATEPVRASHDRIEEQIRHLSETTKEVSHTLLSGAKANAEHARGVLEAAEAALGNEREGIRRSLEATRATLTLLSQESEKLGKIDEMLGKALSNYSIQLEAALGSAQEHISAMQDQLAPGLDTLRSIVDQAESFSPAQNRRP
jgi:ABC-type transporter Mla subunit MlaD